MPKTVLLDVDGTLIDSNDAHARAWIEALEEAGFEPQYPAVRKKIGMGGDHLLPLLTGVAIDDAEGKQINERQGQIFREKYLPKVKAFPGARELVESLRDQGFRLMIATSGSQKDLDQLLKKVGLADLKIPATTADSADSSKPDSDIVEAAMAKAGSTPNETFMIGDTPYDVSAAEKAGVKTIGLTCGGWMKDDLHGAVAVFEGPADLVAHLQNSPLAA